MSEYYVRTFCTSSTVPTLAEVLAYVQEQNIDLQIDPIYKPIVDLAYWKDVPLKYDRDRQSIWSTVHKGNPKSIQRYLEEEDTWQGSRPLEDCDEYYGELVDFFDILASEPDSEEKETVLQHLSETKYIIRNLVPSWSEEFETAEFSAEGEQALAAFLEYFTRNCGGMILTNDEGFFLDNELIMRFTWKE